MYLAATETNKYTLDISFRPVDKIEVCFRTRGNFQCNENQGLAPTLRMATLMHEPIRNQYSMQDMLSPVIESIPITNLVDLDSA